MTPTCCRRSVHPDGPRQFHTGPGDAGPGRLPPGLLLTCIGVQISMSPNRVGGGDLGLAGVPCWDPGGVSASMPAPGVDAGCEIHSSSHPKMDSSSSWSDSSSSGVGGGGADRDEPKKQGGAACSYIRQVVRPTVAFYADVGGDV